MTDRPTDPVNQARVERLAAQVRHLQEENRRLRRELEAVRSSETFRLGARILAGPRWLKQRVVSWRRTRTGGSASRPPSATVRDQPGLAAPTADVRVPSNPSGRPAYRQFPRRRWGNGALVFRVSTLDVDAGRGDLYVAIGLGRALVGRGHDVGIVDDDGPWGARPRAVIVMTAASDGSANLLALEPSVRRIAWVRNNVDEWLRDPALPLYDLVMASSQTSAGRLSRALDREVPVLPIGVDVELFSSDGTTRTDGVVVSTMSQFSRDRPRPLLEDLSKSDIRQPLRLFGVLNGISAELAQYDGGRVPFTAMPDVYRQSAIVLDEPQAGNRQSGCNSRIFEALAVGALPITRPTHALRELGLDELPTFSDATTLSEQVARWATSPERDRLANRLQDVVRKEHSYDVRAENLEKLLERLGPVEYPIVGFFPDYRATNPFQDLLYGQLRRSAAVLPVDGPGELAPHQRMGVPTIFHLHWTAPIIGRAASAREAERSAATFLAGVDEYVAAGGHLVWTIHNVLPHECRFPNVECRLRQGIADRAHGIHVLGPATASLVDDHYALPTEKVIHVDHGSYLGVYPDMTTDEDARRELGFGSGERVLLVFGQIRPYKGIDRLLDAWERDGPVDTTLHVVGAPGRDAESRSLAARVAATPGVRSHLEPVPDVDLQQYLRAADAVLLPHTSVLNSGVVHLASAFGRPVVAPDIGNIRAHTDEGARILYAPGPDGLDEAFRHLHTLDGHGPRRAAYRHAISYTSVDMARDFADALAPLLDRPKGAHRP